MSKGLDTEAIRDLDELLQRRPELRGVGLLGEMLVAAFKDA